jgi:hypothetical protein
MSLGRAFRELLGDIASGPAGEGEGERGGAARETELVIFILRARKRRVPLLA